MATTPKPVAVRTRQLDPTDPRSAAALLDLLPDGPVLSWVRRGEGLVGWGVAAHTRVRGRDRFTAADTWWREVLGRMRIDDPLGVPGSGAVAFTSLAFADEPGESIVLVPRVLIGSRTGTRWITTVGTPPRPKRSPVFPPGRIAYRDGQLPAEAYRQLVATAVRRMNRSGELAKVVLARDLVATTSAPLDARFVLRNLAVRYPECWTFAVDGLIGATPELLLERRGDRVRSRVLAGTTWPRDRESTAALAAELLESPKNRVEHAHAVISLAEQLRPFCTELDVPDQPQVLRLRNVAHLATDITGELADRDGSLLRLAAAAHPTAAVGGTPTELAVRTIEELERLDRGRYAGPVGWLDGNGNGDLGIALRCAQIETAATRTGGGTRGGGRIRLFAGCGIVPDSDPDSEVAETEAKLQPMREALEGR